VNIICARSLRGVLKLASDTAGLVVIGRHFAHVVSPALVCHLAPDVVRELHDRVGCAGTAAGAGLVPHTHRVTHARSLRGVLDAAGRAAANVGEGGVIVVHAACIGIALGGVVLRALHVALGLVYFAGSGGSALTEVTDLSADRVAQVGRGVPCTVLDGIAGSAVAGGELALRGAGRRHGVPLADLTVHGANSARADAVTGLDADTLNRVDLAAWGRSRTGSQIPSVGHHTRVNASSIDPLAVITRIANIDIVDTAALQRAEARHIVPVAAIIGAVAGGGIVPAVLALVDTLAQGPHAHGVHHAADFVVL